MSFHLLALGPGLALLLGGGVALVSAASALARQLGVPPLVIGLTVVGFGTSAPELGVNLVAALHDRSDMAFGNVVGSNLANVGLILGAAALLRPLHVEGVVIRREIPMMLLASTFAWIMACDELRGTRLDTFDRAEGLLLLLLFGVFLYYTVGDTLRKRPHDPLIAQVREENVVPDWVSVGSSVMVAAGGLLALVGGAELTVRGASGLARDIGMSEATVALTVVAIGTSLPELVTTLIAAARGESDLAVGNVVGSNIFNLLLILGLTAVVRPVSVPAGGQLDLGLTVLMSAALIWLAATHERRITRGEGAILAAVYLVYMAWRVTARG